MLLTVLSLGVIFGAGWAAGTGRTPVQPAPAAINVQTDEKSPEDTNCPDGGCDEKDKCPDGNCPDSGRDKFKLPRPPIMRRRIIRMN